MRDEKMRTRGAKNAAGGSVFSPTSHFFPIVLFLLYAEEYEIIGLRTGRTAAEGVPEMTNSETREILEAINAGNAALESMRKALKQLNSAGTWGIVDIFGGGLITDLIKHKKMNDARENMERANADLNRFSRELRDVPAEYLHIDNGGFLGFADFAFDGFLADMLMQNKISEAKAQLNRMIPRTEETVRRLNEYLREG